MIADSVQTICHQDEIMLIDQNYREHIDVKKPKNVLFPSKISNNNNTTLWQY